MANGMTRRETLKRGTGGRGALALVPEWALPALAQGEVDVPFTDFPANFIPSPADGARRTLDLRKIDGLITPADQFFFIQHYDKPEIDAAAYRLKLTGLVAKPTELSLADLQSMRLDRRRQRLRVLREQPARHAGAVVQRPVHRRQAARRAASRRR